MYLSEQAISERYGTAFKTVREIAEAYYFQGRLDEALALWQHAKPLIEAREVQPTQRVEFLLGYAQFLIHHYFLTNGSEEPMQTVIQQTLQEAQAIQDEAATATAYYLTGQSQYYHNLLTGATDYAEARGNLEQASALRENVGDGYGLSESLFYTGLTYDRAGPDERTRAYLQRVLALAEHYGNIWAASEALRHLTDYTEGDERLRCALRSLELREEAKFTVGLPAAQLLVSEVYSARGELAQAWDYCQRAEQLSTALGIPFYRMSALLTAGEIAYQRGQLAEAHAYLEQGRALAHELHMARGIAVAEEKLALLAGEQASE